MPSPTARPPGKQHPHRQHPYAASVSSANTPNHHYPPANRPEQNHHSSPAFPFSLRLPFQSNPTSASLAPSIAEGKPIPVDDTTAEHRTSALRQLNHNYPSRHRYAKSTGAQNTTYSEPVIVRSYYTPLPPSRTNAVARHSGGVIVRAPSAVPGSVADSTASRRRSTPLFTGKVSTAGNGVRNIMARARGRGSGHAHAHPEEAKLPPVEAFTFKSFIATLDEQGNGNDISSDLDRIAEICARSRYSLSNQYEVHYGPHGSGANFAPGNQQGPEHQGPTLQAVTSDDERQTRTERKRRMGGRRNSRAMGTLETIMSSSRSSDDDKSKKKSAAELAEQVRGRAATKPSSQHSSAATSTRSNTRDERRSRNEEETTSPPKKRPSSRRTSSSLALIDNAKPFTAAASDTSNPTSQTHHHSRAASASASAALVSEPALPQPATSQLEIQTSTNTTDPAPPTRHARSKSDGHLIADKLSGKTTATGAISSVDDVTATGLLSTLAGWIPWAAAAPTPAATENGSAAPGRAEGSLRNLLKAVPDKDT